MLAKSQGGLEPLPCSPHPSRVAPKVFANFSPGLSFGTPGLKLATTFGVPLRLAGSCHLAPFKNCTTLPCKWALCPDVANSSRNYYLPSKRSQEIYGCAPDDARDLGTKSY